MQLFEELKRRNVFRVGIAYVVASWLLIEASTVTMEGLGSPEWVPKVLATILAIGFPLVLIFSWAYEITPEGLKRESEVDHSKSITHVTSRRLDMIRDRPLVSRRTRDPRTSRRSSACGRSPPW